MLIAWIAIFGALGTLTRFAFTSMLLQSGTFPVSTLTVNMAGSFLVGLLWGTSLQPQSTPSAFLLVATTGFLGGFTTFSAFSLEVVRLVAQQKFLPALAYAVGSPVACIAMAAAGAWMTYTLNTR
jgi:fluoride exporter